MSSDASDGPFPVLGGQDYLVHVATPWCIHVDLGEATMSEVPHGCTIATNSTAASAAVAAASFCEHHPGSTFTVLELAPTDSLCDVPAVSVVTPEAIGAPLEEIATVTMIGDPQSLHSFCQPYLFRYLIREHSSSVTCAPVTRRL
jgi:hypothetical protein